MTEQTVTGEVPRVDTRAQDSENGDEMTTLQLIFYVRLIRRWKRIPRLERAQWQPWGDIFLADKEQRAILKATDGMTRQEKIAWTLARHQDRAK